MITRRVYFTLKYHTSFKVLLFLRSHRYVRVHYRDMARPAFPKVSRLIYRLQGDLLVPARNKAMPDSQDTECVHVQYAGLLDGEKEAKGEQKKINEPSDHVLK